MAPEGLTNYVDFYTDLIADGIKVLIFAGEWDSMDGVNAQQNIIKKIDFPNKEKYYNQQRSFYYYSDLSPGASGYFRQVDEFAFVIVPNAGHVTWTTNVELTASVLGDWVSSGKVACNSIAGCELKSTKIVDEYLKGCNSNKHHLNATCNCETGFGYDCG